MPREKFESIVLFKKPQDVIKIIGRPDQRSGSFPFEQTGSDDWMYKHKTYDPLTGHADSYTWVKIRFGIVAEVTYW